MGWAKFELNWIKNWIKWREQDANNMSSTYYMIFIFIIYLIILILKETDERFNFLTYCQYKIETNKDILKIVENNDILKKSEWSVFWSFLIHSNILLACIQDI